MLKQFFVGLAFLFLVGTFAASSARAEILVDNRLRTGAAEFVSDEILVKFKPGADIDAINQHLDAISARITYSGVYRVKVPPDRLDELLKSYKENPRVAYAELNHIRKALMTPNDPGYFLQWHLDNPVYGGIEMEQAWDIKTGDSGVVVAVIDTGVAYENYGDYCLAPDLANTTFVPGYDFINDDTHPNDDAGHGTHVTGTIAQSTNNNEGVAGVAFNTAIMPVKVLNESGNGLDSDVADGIMWATDNGAHIINLSLGGSSPSITLENACKYAYNNGVTIVASSGNNNNSVGYPAVYEEVIAVGATRYDETRAYYSNYGSELDLVAPGGDLTVDQNGDGQPDGVLQQTFDPINPCDFGYWWYQGTSMASPHVAGVAALLHAQGIISPDDVRDRLQSTADDLGDSGWDEFYGWGLVNAERALEAPAPKPGDVNNNGAITAYDAAMVLQYVVGLTIFSLEEQKAADVTGDNTVSALDAALILQYTVGLITSFPVDSVPAAPALNPEFETKLITEAIEQLDASHLMAEQKRVLALLKGLISPELSTTMMLWQNFPNPFNPETWIPFQLSDDAPVTIRIYNAKGQLVRALHLGTRKAGVYLTKDKAAYWNGRDGLGEKVASGVYFYTFQAGGKFKTTRKMTIVK